MKISSMLISIIFVFFYQPSIMAKDKPIIIVGQDGFPSGSKTPEGAACDLARAFIKKDKELFASVCIKPYTSNNGPSEYVTFLKNKIEEIKTEAEKKEPSPEGPKSIGKVFAARHLSKNGPASYGHATFGFKDIMFVDVGVIQHNEIKVVIRALVIQDKTEKWFVLPMPEASPLLSEGLNEEKKSTKDFSDEYIILQNSEVIIPKGVKYEKVSEDINLLCQEYILKLLENKNKERETVASALGIIGPGMWKRVSSTIKTDGDKLIDSNLITPILGTDKSITSKAATWRNCQVISQLFQLTIDLEIKNANILIRKLTVNELSDHWAIISWDIKEPLFILEINKTKYLLSFEEKDKNFTLSYIDDISNSK